MKDEILIIAAVEAELAGLIRRIGSVKRSFIGRRRLWQGNLADWPVSLVITGPGMVNTAQALTAAIEALAPGMILQTGCAGAFEAAGLTVGDIGVATAEIDVHAGIEAADNPEFPDPLPFALLATDAISVWNKYPIDSRLAETAASGIRSEMGRSNIGGPLLKVRTGPFVTVSTVTATDGRAKRLYRKFSPCMENMEGAAAAHLALHYEIPLVEIRAACNMVGKRDPGAWNRPLAFERAGEAVYQLVKCRLLTGAIRSQ